MKTGDLSRFAPDAYVTPADGQVSSDVAGETVILNLETGQYHGLEGVGTRVWELMGDGSTVGRLLASLLEEFEVSEEECRHDLARLLGDLEERGLIEVGDAPPPQDAP